MKAALWRLLSILARLEQTVGSRPIASVEKARQRCLMGTRYTLLRESIAYFAASPEAQLAHDLGADDALHDIPYPLSHMLEHGEITTAEVELIRPLEELIEQYCAREGVKPWEDERVLFSDEGWARIRDRATDILAQLPDEERASDWTRDLKEIR